MTHRLWMLVTYPWHRHAGWERPCGCSFRRTPTGWLHTQCLDHWLD